MIRSYDNDGITIILACWFSLAAFLLREQYKDDNGDMSSNCSVLKEEVFLSFVSEHKALNSVVSGPLCD